MTRLDEALGLLRGLIDMGGTVVVLLLVMSVVAGAVTIAKLWQFHARGVGRHAALHQALHLWTTGAPGRARSALHGTAGLTPILQLALSADPALRPALRDRLHAMAEGHMARLESGFRLLDVIAQLGPLLGLFGTVLGMIDAFRAMQAAGTEVDPSVLAGGIWVALLTTAVGLAVAMSSSLVLAWLESRTAGERVMAEVAIETLCGPVGAAPAEPPLVASGHLAHAG